MGVCLLDGIPDPMNPVATTRWLQLATRRSSLSVSIQPTGMAVNVGSNDTKPANDGYVPRGIELIKTRIINSNLNDHHLDISRP